MELLRGPDPKRRNLAYQLLNGFVEIETEEMQVSREHMRIEPLIETIYQSRLKLCARTGLDFEDDTLETIINTYEQLNRLLAERMYNQGWYDAKQVFQA